MQPGARQASWSTAERMPCPATHNDRVSSCDRMKEGGTFKLSRLPRFGQYRTVVPPSWEGCTVLRRVECTVRSRRYGRPAILSQLSRPGSKSYGAFVLVVRYHDSRHDPGFVGPRSFFRAELYRDTVTQHKSMYYCVLQYCDSSAV